MFLGDKVRVFKIIDIFLLIINIDFIDLLGLEVIFVI